MEGLQCLSLAIAIQLLLGRYFLVQFGGTFVQASSQDSKADPPVQLLIQKTSCVMSNGILSVTLSTPSGMVTKISYNGVSNLLEEQNKEDDRGYWNIVRNPNETEDRLIGTSYKVVVDNADQKEISFTRTYSISSGDKAVPLIVDKRFVMLRGSHGFYTYTLLERLEGWPNMEIAIVRVVFKLQQNMTYFMAMSDARQRIMPTLMDRMKGVVLDYEEAVQLINPSNPDFKGEVDDKYFYTGHNKDNKVYGWVSLSNSPIGFWMITPTNEFRNGGPFKQELTSHVGPTILNVFTSGHYAGEDLTFNFGDGKPWKKVFGPVFVYLNSNPQAKANPSILWDDAKRTTLEETSKWPYNFPNSTAFVKPNQRGVVRGRLLVFDRYVNNNSQAAAFAYVGLANPGDAGSWQRESKGYQFWTGTDSRGNFIIRNVIPGKYSLYASVPGNIGDYKYQYDVIVNPGSNVNVGNLVYQPPRNGPTLWEIGIPDRSAAEFFIPKPQPTFKVHVYKQGQDRDLENEYKITNFDFSFREYGLWRRYTDLYPNNDLVYTVGLSNYTKDWFFAHVTRLTRNNSYVSTTWQIIFDLPTVKTSGSYTLQLVLAAAKAAVLQVRFNDEHAVNPHFSTGLIGDDNSVARHGIHGLYWLYTVEVTNNLLVKGKNTIFLRQARGSNKFPNVMYDYIRFEEPK